MAIWITNDVSECLKEETGRNMLLQNVGALLPDKTVSRPGKAQREPCTLL